MKVLPFLFILLIFSRGIQSDEDDDFIPRQERNYASLPLDDEQQIAPYAVSSSATTRYRVTKKPTPRSRDQSKKDDRGNSLGEGLKQRPKTLTRSQVLSEAGKKSKEWKGDSSNHAFHRFLHEPLPKRRTKIRAPTNVKTTKHVLSDLQKNTPSILAYEIHPTTTVTPITTFSPSIAIPTISLSTTLQPPLAPTSSLSTTAIQTSDGTARPQPPTSSPPISAFPTLHRIALPTLFSTTAIPTTHRTARPLLPTSSLPITTTATARPLAATSSSTARPLAPTSSSTARPLAPTSSSTARPFAPTSSSTARSFAPTSSSTTAIPKTHRTTRPSVSTSSLPISAIQASHKPGSSPLPVSLLFTTTIPTSHRTSDTVLVTTAPVTTTITPVTTIAAPICTCQTPSINITSTTSGHSPDPTTTPYIIPTTTSTPRPPETNRPRVRISTAGHPGSKSTPYLTVIQKSLHGISTTTKATPYNLQRLSTKKPLVVTPPIAPTTVFFTPELTTTPYVASLVSHSPSIVTQPAQTSTPVIVKNHFQNIQATTLKTEELNSDSFGLPHTTFQPHRLKTSTQALTRLKTVSPAAIFFSTTVPSPSPKPESVVTTSPDSPLHREPLPEAQPYVSTISTLGASFRQPFLPFKISDDGAEISYGDRQSAIQPVIHESVLHSLDAKIKPHVPHDASTVPQTLVTTSTPVAMVTPVHLRISAFRPVISNQAHLDFTPAKFMPRRPQQQMEWKGDPSKHAFHQFHYEPLKRKPLHGFKPHKSESSTQKQSRVLGQAAFGIRTASAEQTFNKQPTIPQFPVTPVIIPTPAITPIPLTIPLRTTNTPLGPPEEIPLLITPHPPLLPTQAPQPRPHPANRPQRPPINIIRPPPPLSLTVAASIRPISTSTLTPPLIARLPPTLGLLPTPKSPPLVIDEPTRQPPTIRPTFVPAITPSSIRPPPPTRLLQTIRVPPKRPPPPQFPLPTKSPPHHPLPTRRPPHQHPLPTRPPPPQHPPPTRPPPQQHPLPTRPPPPQLPPPSRPPPPQLPPPTRPPPQQHPLPTRPPPQQHPPPTRPPPQQHPPPTRPPPQQHPPPTRPPPQQHPLPTRPPPQQHPPPTRPPPQQHPPPTRPSPPQLPEPTRPPPPQLLPSTIIPPTRAPPPTRLPPPLSSRPPPLQPPRSPPSRLPPSNTPEAYPDISTTSTPVFPAPEPSPVVPPRPSRPPPIRLPSPTPLKPSTFLISVPEASHFIYPPPGSTTTRPPAHAPQLPLPTRPPPPQPSRRPQVTKLYPIPVYPPAHPATSPPTRAPQKLKDSEWGVDSWTFQFPHEVPQQQPIAFPTSLSTTDPSYAVTQNIKHRPKPPSPHPSLPIPGPIFGSAHFSAIRPVVSDTPSPAPASLHSQHSAPKKHQLPPQSPSKPIYYPSSGLSVLPVIQVTTLRPPITTPQTQYLSHKPQITTIKLQPVQEIPASALKIPTTRPQPFQTHSILSLEATTHVPRVNYSILTHPPSLRISSFRTHSSTTLAPLKQPISITQAPKPEIDVPVSEPVPEPDAEPSVGTEWTGDASKHAFHQFHYQPIRRWPLGPGPPPQSKSEVRPVYQKPLSPNFDQPSSNTPIYKPSRKPQLEPLPPTPFPASITTPAKSLTSSTLSPHQYSEVLSQYEFPTPKATPSPPFKSLETVQLVNPVFPNNDPQKSSLSSASPSGPPKQNSRPIIAKTESSHSQNEFSHHQPSHPLSPDKGASEFYVALPVISVLPYNVQEPPVSKTTARPPIPHITTARPLPPPVPAIHIQSQHKQSLPHQRPATSEIAHSPINNPLKQSQDTEVKQSPPPAQKLPSITSNLPSSTPPPQAILDAQVISRQMFPIHIAQWSLPFTVPWLQSSLQTHPQPSPNPHQQSFRSQPSPQSHHQRLRPEPSPQPHHQRFRPEPLPQPHQEPFRLKPSPQPHQESFRPEPSRQPHQESFRLKPSPEPHQEPFQLKPSPQPHQESFRLKSSPQPHHEPFRPRPEPPSQPHQEPFRLKPSSQPHHKPFRSEPPPQPHQEHFQPEPSPQPHHESFRLKPSSQPHHKPFWPESPSQLHQEPFRPDPSPQPHQESFRLKPSLQPHHEPFQPGSPFQPHQEPFGLKPSPQPHQQSFHPQSQPLPHQQLFRPQPPPRQHQQPLRPQLLSYHSVGPQSDYFPRHPPQPAEDHKEWSGDPATHAFHQFHFQPLRRWPLGPGSPPRFHNFGTLPLRAIFTQDFQTRSKVLQQIESQKNNQRGKDDDGGDTDEEKKTNKEGKSEEDKDDLDDDDQEGNQKQEGKSEEDKGDLDDDDQEGNQKQEGNHKTVKMESAKIPIVSQRPHFWFSQDYPHPDSDYQDFPIPESSSHLLFQRRPVALTAPYNNAYETSISSQKSPIEKMTAGASRPIANENDASFTSSQSSVFFLVPQRLSVKELAKQSAPFQKIRSHPELASAEREPHD